MTCKRLQLDLLDRTGLPRLDISKGKVTNHVLHAIHIVRNWRHLRAWPPEHADGVSHIRRIPMFKDGASAHGLRVAIAYPRVSMCYSICH